MVQENEFGQPVGESLGAWTSPPLPDGRLDGRRVSLTPLGSDGIADALANALADTPASDWTYLPFGPAKTAAEFGSIIDGLISQPDWCCYAIEVGGEVAGFLAYLRIDARAGSIEIGSILFGPSLQRTAAATEVIHLLISHAFELGYRRLEWKCDDLNAPSRRAAERFGFTYEGTFRRHTHYKGRSRDTAWFAITFDDWPRIDAGYRRWLDPANFDPDGQQRSALSVGEHR